MSHSDHEPKVPRPALIAVGLMIALTIGAAALTRLSGVDPQPMALGEPAQSRDLRFVDGSTGSVEVYDWDSGAMVLEIPPQGEPFLRVVLRSMVRERRTLGLTELGPFRVTQTTDGHFTLMDTVSGRWMVLRAFGETNARAFSRFLDEDPQRTQAAL